MLVDLFGLMGAYGVGSSHDGFTTACGSYMLASGIAAYGAIAFLAFILKNPAENQAAGKQLEKLEILTRQKKNSRSCSCSQSSQRRTRTWQD